MFRKGVVVLILLSFLTSINFSLAEANTEITKKFSQAQQLTAQGQIVPAIKLYQSLIQTNPLLPEAYNNLAALYLKQNKTKKAKHVLEQGLYAHKSYGVLYESLTAINVAMAREAYSKALQIDLKPSEIMIASLSLADRGQRHKINEIVISKLNQAKIRQPNISQTKVRLPAVTKLKPVGKIKRDKVAVIQQRPIAKKKQNTTGLDKTLKAWSIAWSAQAADIYLSFYHKHYQPSSGISRKRWEQSRRTRLTKPRWIKVALSNIKVTRKSAKQAVVEFNQLYQSNSFRDVSKKQMVLIHTDAGWRIYREQSI